MSYDYNGLINVVYGGVVYGDGTFVALSYSSNKSVTSTDNGETWKGQKHVSLTPVLNKLEYCSRREYVVKCCTH